MTNSGPRPMLAYWHLWTDAEGVSHQQRCELTAFELKGVGPADPQWNDQQPRTEATTVFTVRSRSVGWATGTRTRRHNGSFPFQADGGSKPWMARVPKWVRASFRLARIRAVSQMARGGVDIGRVQLEISRRC